MQIEFSGRAVLITGAGSGIGLATAELFGRCGADLSLVDVNATAVEAAADGLRQGGSRVVTVCADISHSDEVDRAVQATVAAFGRLDVLFANAGVGSSASITEASDEHWEEVMGVNARGTFFCCRQAIRQMLAQSPPGGAIIINSSISGLAGIPGQGVYGPSKGAVLQMARQLGVEYAARGIRVNCVCPGTVDTPVLRLAMAESGDGDGLLSMLTAGHPLGRIGRPEEVASAVVFLASEHASFIAGAALVVDGGFTAR